MIENMIQQCTKIMDLCENIKEDNARFRIKVECTQEYVKELFSWHYFEDDCDQWYMENGHL